MVINKGGYYGHFACPLSVCLFLFRCFIEARSVPPPQRCFIEARSVPPPQKKNIQRKQKYHSFKWLG